MSWYINRLSSFYASPFYLYKLEFKKQIFWFIVRPQKGPNEVFGDFFRENSLHFAENFENGDKMQGTTPEIFWESKDR